MVNIFKDLRSNYILVIAEKPKAAEKIALALGEPTKYYIDKVPVWVVYRNSECYVIASAVGHMYSLYTSEKGYPVYSYRWVPRYLVEKNVKHAKLYLDVLSRLSQKAKIYINACDYDIEGSVIGYMIIKHHGNEEKAFRAKFSSLVHHEIIKAFENLSRLDYEIIEAGICRHVLDWLWGINISRALMDIYIHIFNTRKALSAGRVQTPTLAYAIDLILQRRLFVPKPLIYPTIYIRIGNKIYHLESMDPPFASITEAYTYIEQVKKEPRAYIENISIDKISYNPPYPFNLSDLQSEAYRILKMSPYKTQKIAEELYLEALISYPRTNSQKLPPRLNHRDVLEKLALNVMYKPFVEKLITETKGILRPNNGPKDDPAHPAIYPTGERITKKLSSLHIKLYDLIVRRYLATFAQSLVTQQVKIVINIHGRNYVLRGTKVLSRGWIKYYPYISIEEQDIEVDPLKKGMHIPVERAELITRYTQPPKSPTRLTLIKWMESVGIGTEATRAEIVETLFRRGYIFSRSRYIDVSDLAIAFMHILKNYVKELVSVDLTREFEEMLNNIINKKLSCKDIEEKAKLVINTYIQDIKQNISSIASDIGKYINISNKKSTDSRCKICERIVYTDNLCIFHYEALHRLREGYTEWQKFGYTWNNYLEKLSKLKTSGIYVRDVCRYLLMSKTRF